MRFGHYTVFDTPEENKHTQVYVEYDVPNNDDLEGATGTIVLTEGGQGSGGGGDAGNGIRSISISPAITTDPALESLFPIYYEDLTDEQKEEHMVQISANANSSLTLGDSYDVTIEPTPEMYLMGGEEFGEQGEPVTFSCEVVDVDGNVLKIETVATNTMPPAADSKFFSMELTIVSA